MNLELLAATKLPEHIRAEYPALVAFVEAYYRFLDTQESIRDAADIDTVSSKYLAQYKNTFLKNFSDPSFLSVRTFIQHNKEFFSKKGTPDAFKIFFKAYFGEDIEVKTPIYLIASGGEIAGSHFMYITKRYGSLNTGDRFNISTANGIFIIHADLVVDLDIDTQIVYFNLPRGFSSNIGDECTVKVNDRVQFLGEIEATPARITQVLPGKYWQIGQLISFPSSDPSGTPTIARVKRIDSNSGISAIEIIQYGFPHSIDQTYILSPFPSKPQTGAFVYTQTITQNSPRIYAHTLTINDSTNTTTEDITGAGSVSGSVNSYFAENYILEDYVSELLFAQINNVLNPITSIIPEDYTFAMWEESKTILKMNFGSFSRERQEYLTEDGLLSNQNTRLHDNLNYQAFAYYIKTRQDISKYEDSLELLHPAGMKFSTELIRDITVDASSRLNYTAEHI